jgi:salicylate hydroxylase
MNADYLKVIIVGAGLGGLGAAIAILLAGHDVEVLESASEISEVEILRVRRMFAQL